MMLHDLPAIARGLAALPALDPDLARIAAREPALGWERREGGFAGLLRIILGQQVSTLAADAMWAKLARAVVPLTPETLAAADPDALRGCGFSRQKMAYAHGLAADVAEGRLDLDALAGLDDEAAIAALVRVKGIGRWSAEIYLMFVEGRGDVFPAADLGVLLGMQWLKGWAERPTPDAVRTAAEPWRPYRSAASLLLWVHYMETIRLRRAETPKPARAKTIAKAKVAAGTP